MARTMGFEECSALLKKYRIPLVKMKTVKTVSDAVSYAKLIGYPVVLKIDSSDIVHKTDKGCVITSIGNEEELRDSYAKIMRRAHGAKVRGMVVQEQSHGVEIIIGGKVDSQFGEVVLFGLGGIFVEIMKDVSVSITPVSKENAMAMIKSIKGYPVLAGARGKKPVDLGAIADTIVKVSQLHSKHKEISELDLNPAFVDEHGIKVADVRMILEAER